MMDSMPEALSTLPARSPSVPIPEDLLASLFPTAEEIPRIDEVEMQLIERALEVCDGNVSEAAARLGMSRATLYRRLGRIGRKVS